MARVRGGVKIKAVTPQNKSAVDKPLYKTLTAAYSRAKYRINNAVTAGYSLRRFESDEPLRLLGFKK